MSILPILVYPDPRLKQISAPVESLDEETRLFIADLQETMAASPGCVGIAAPQVGILKRVIVVDASRSKKPCQAHGHMVLINPVISDPQGAELGREGCLSLPDFTANVMRAQSIKVEAQNLHGDNLSFTTTGFEARIILHEADHLDGLLFLDRVSSLKTDVFRRKRY